MLDAMKMQWIVSPYLTERRMLASVAHFGFPVRVRKRLQTCLQTVLRVTVFPCLAGFIVLLRKSFCKAVISTCQRSSVAKVVFLFTNAIGHVIMIQYVFTRSCASNHMHLPVRYRYPFSTLAGNRKQGTKGKAMTPQWVLGRWMYMPRKNSLQFWKMLQTRRN